MSQKGPYRAPRRLYLTADKSRVVEESDPEAASLLAGAGAEVSQADVERYKLRELPEPSEAEGRAEDAEDAPASEGEARGKAVAGPPEDKAQAGPSGAEGQKPAARRGAGAKDSA